jgi:hypothetical protein
MARCRIRRWEAFKTGNDVTFRKSDRSSLLVFHIRLPSIGNQLDIISIVVLSVMAKCLFRSPERALLEMMSSFKILDPKLFCKSGPLKRFVYLLPLKPIPGD